MGHRHAGRDAANAAQRRHDEVVATEAGLQRTEAAIERYVRAFEAGTVSDEMFGPRVRELGDQARTLRARRLELAEADDAAAADPPTRADLDAMHAVLEEMIRHGSDARRKAVAQAFVHRLVVVEPGVVQPIFLVRGGLPAEFGDDGGKTAPNGASRAVTSSVGPVGIEPTTEGL